MIRVVIKNNTISVIGHANYADYGKDIVCASVSSVIGTVVNCIMNIDRDSIAYCDDGKTVSISLISNNEVVEKIFITMIDILKDLEKQYKENIKIESEE